MFFSSLDQFSIYVKPEIFDHPDFESYYKTIRMKFCDMIYPNDDSHCPEESEWDTGKSLIPKMLFISVHLGDKDRQQNCSKSLAYAYRGASLMNPETNETQPAFAEVIVEHAIMKVNWLRYKGENCHWIFGFYAFI